MTLDEAHNAAQAVLRPDNLIWLIVGDRKKIEAGLEALQLGRSAN